MAEPKWFRATDPQSKRWVEVAHATEFEGFLAVYSDGGSAIERDKRAKYAPYTPIQNVPIPLSMAHYRLMEWLESDPPKSQQMIDQLIAAKSAWHYKARQLRRMWPNPTRRLLA